ncbi:tRNA (5-methylaminomethyl-2-thiouridine)(34)-methyltransferase MnmD [Olleya sp. HaHaR_3_96]|uniref:tRNA (5-methylaminomethyl-2-thiouridine)(34)-methyltransferase MnmD n=1 Tax=Olleya sp. HaHaR_3_96 TaxID=2745560 RepID=UPI001C4F5781|nr:tRNA (5-methylaminomethyl-2-thiouridine)(34)-methyltransferase MnmD [Olleya sp. HaHaR_3_96]QXP59731.1 tRNA (5-methylaminomethyl-2-thiouridine)(34)-methyltransferase MnmD [Olleya sp. HaHaR_3_96]
MEPQIELTKDGSSTLLHPKYNALYHSTYGAIEESNFVYINAGLFSVLSSETEQDVEQSCSILEVGFGSGLNAFNTFLKTEALPVNINYVGIETFPVGLDIVEKLNYPELFSKTDKQSVFKTMHEVSWETKHHLSSQFTFEKRNHDIFNLKISNQFDVIYYDAFGPGAQPELWTAPIFEIMFEALKKNGVLITYCAQGAARRAMISVGFKVERLPGPPNKRHILRAIKV